MNFDEINLSLKCTSENVDERHLIAESVIQPLVKELNEVLTLFHDKYCYMPNIVSFFGKEYKKGKWFEIESVTAISSTHNGTFTEQGCVIKDKKESFKIKSKYPLKDVFSFSYPEGASRERNDS